METKDYSIIAGVPAELFGDKTCFMNAIEMMIDIKKLTRAGAYVALPVEVRIGERGRLVFSFDEDVIGAVSGEYADKVIPFIGKYDPFMFIFILETPQDLHYGEKYVTFFVMECYADDKGVRDAEDFTFFLDAYNGSGDLDTGNIIS